MTDEDSHPCTTGSTSNCCDPTQCIGPRKSALCLPETDRESERERERERDGFYKDNERVLNRREIVSKRASALYDEINPRLRNYVHITRKRERERERANLSQRNCTRGREIAREGERRGTLEDSFAILQSAEIAQIVVHAGKKERKREKEGASDCKSSVGASVWRLLLSYNSIPRVIPRYMDG